VQTQGHSAAGRIRFIRDVLIDSLRRNNKEQRKHGDTGSVLRLVAQRLNQLRYANITNDKSSSSSSSSKALCHKLEGRGFET
jgi:hypothetical protein